MIYQYMQNHLEDRNVCEDSYVNLYARDCNLLKLPLCKKYTGRDNEQHNAKYRNSHHHMAHIIVLFNDLLLNTLVN